MEKTIYVKEELRVGRSPAEAATLLLKELKNLAPDEKEVRLVLPRVWSWHENRQWMQRNMFELGTLLVEVAGADFVFGCECSQDKELSITARRYS